MKKYREWSPTPFDTAGLLGDSMDRNEWLVLPLVQTRDSGPFDQSNFAAALALLGGEGDEVEVHRFGHWGPGWVEIILVAPGGEAEKEALDIESRLENYPVLDDEDLSRREQEEADETWEVLFDVKERVRYIRKHRSQFEFRDFSDMLACVRGKYFAGYASELCGY